LTRVLITGGAGFIGSHLAETFLARGDRVTVIDNLSTGRFENIAHLAPNLQFDFAIDTIENDVVLDRLASQADLIVHLAAVVGVRLVVESPVDTIVTNIDGTAAVLHAAPLSRGRRRAPRGDQPQPLVVRGLQDGRRVPGPGLCAPV